MGRWRPPAPKSSPYITAAGFEKLTTELKQRWVSRREVVAALSAAAAEGDRSENAEYIYRKKQLAGIDRRIRYLQKRLPVLQVVDRAPDDMAVRFGAWVTLQDHKQNTTRYRIVGADEIDHDAAYISVDAPVARALLGKLVNDRVEVQVGEEPLSLRVIDIHYDE